MKDRTISLKVSLTSFAKDFGYDLEVDQYSDVHHNGYSSSDIKKMGLSMPKGMDDLDKLFPSAVSVALEDAERDAYGEAIRKERINALKDALEEINLTQGGAEYQDMNGKMISAKAGILSATIEESDDSLVLEILNPEHLINAIISGVGMFAPELSSEEAESQSEISSRIHNLKYYFEVWGVSDDGLKEHLKFRLEDISLEEVADCVKDAVDESLMDAKQAMKLATEHTQYKIEDIKKVLVDKINDQVDFWNKTI